ncbi:MAG: 2 protein [Pseudomonadota bacterium]|nr:2 protein [Pseudomonadota bacterium]
MQMNANLRTLAMALFGLFLFKVGLAALLPITGDEAYFVQWGRHLDYGYYDHPPMAGWMVWFQLLLSDHLVWLRMPAILTELAISLLLYWIARPYGENRAVLLALIYALSPLMLINVMILTDTGSILFGALSFALTVRGLQTGRMAWFAAAGAALGLAFLSKYFAVLLGLGYFIYFFVIDRSRWRQGLLLLGCVLPFVALNLAWNATHCWTNILFNLVNRHAGGGEKGGPGSLLAYLGMLVLFITPWLLKDLWRTRRTPLSEALRLARVLALTGLAAFGLLSWGKNIGLHWVLWLYPMILLPAVLLPEDRLRRQLRYFSLFSLALVVLLAVVLAVPLSTWAKHDKYGKSVVLGFRGQDVVTAFDRASGGLPLASTGYTASGMLAFHAGRDVMVLGPGSKYARMDDFWTDLRDYHGRDIAIYFKNDGDIEKLKPYFETTRVVTVPVAGVNFRLLVGQRFDYPSYRRDILTQVRARYYDLPAWLPNYGCGFLEKYFPDRGASVHSNKACV